MCPFNFLHIKKSISEKNIPPKWIFYTQIKLFITSYVRCSLFAVRCSLFAVRCSLFAVRCSLPHSKIRIFKDLCKFLSEQFIMFFLFFKSDKCRKLSHIFQIFRDFHPRYKALLAYEVYPQYEFYP